MLNIRNILVPIDLSDESRWTVRYGWTLAARFGAQIHLFYADVLHGPLQGTAATSQASRDAVDRMKALADDIADHDREHSRVDIRFAVERNVYPGPAILEYAHDHDIDLIVMGTHGRRGVSRLVLGSVAEEVVRQAQCPVFALRIPDEETPNHVDLGSVLVPYDFSEHSKNALRHAKEFAAAFGSRIDLLHVIEERLHPAFYGIAVQSIYDIDPDIERKSVEHLRRAYESIGGPEMRVTYEARPGSAAREIVAYAAEREASIILMGTHGLTGLDHFLLGSTTERVIRRAGSPVLALKSYGKSLLERAGHAEAVTAR